MQIRFNINETIETEMYYGLYAIYILGGHHIETNPDFYIEIKNIKNGEDIELNEKLLKARDYNLGRKAIQFYTFQINDYGKFRISAHNFQDMIVKESILAFFPLPFSIPHMINSFLKGESRKPKDINRIEILIQ